MGGWASAIGGFGQAAGDFGEGVRNRNLQQWSTIQGNLTSMLDEAYKNAETPELRSQILDARSKAAKFKPGEDPTKLIQNIHQLVNVHPASLNLMGIGQAQKQSVTPGPAAPGQTPGAGPTLPNLTSIGQAQQATAGPAAQPSTSLVQPDGQSPAPIQSAPQSAPPAPQSAPQAQAAPQAAPQAQAPAAAPARSFPMMTLPTLGGGMDAALKNYTAFHQQGQVPPEALSREVAPYLTNQAELEKQAELINSRLGYLNQPEVLSQIPENLRPFVMLEAMGSNLGGMAISRFMGARQIHINATPMSPQEKAIYGLPPDATGMQIVNVDWQGNPMGSNVGPGFVAPRNAYDSQGNEFLYDPTNPSSTQPLTAPGGGSAVAPSQLANIRGISPTGTESVTNMATLKHGGAALDTHLIPPTMIPHVTESLRDIKTVGPNGSEMTTLVPVQSTSTPLLPGGHAPAGSPSAGLPSVGGSPSSLKGANQSFEQPLTPGQQVADEQKLNQQTFASNRLAGLRGQLHLLDSLIDSGKMQLQTSGGVLKAVIAREVPMTDAERKFAADFITATEDINQLRGPLGSTGFRGPEAWAALQNQKGNLLAHPDITRRIMENSIAAFHLQMSPIAHKLKRDLPPTTYIKDGRQYNIPADKELDFITQFPNATMK